MGADLYINSIYQVNQTKYQPIFDAAVKARNKVSKGLPDEVSQLAVGLENRTFSEAKLDNKGRIILNTYSEKIKKIRAAQKKVIQAIEKLDAPEGYFRDSYNGTSLFWALGLSWWHDVGELINSRGQMSPRNAKKLLTLIKSKKLKKITKKALIENRCQIDDENTVKSWQRYYEDKKARFETFLQTAIDLNEPIDCSI
jgi:hypothetical protein